MLSPLDNYPPNQYPDKSSVIRNATLGHDFEGHVRTSVSGVLNRYLVAESFA